MSCSACSRATRPLRREPKKTRKRTRGNGRGLQGLQTRQGNVLMVNYNQNQLIMEKIREM
uniref:Alternative protein SKIV2L2 n=1 Tax=Homo sapiens TaxID=9606 RepID=L8E9T8_HUMAN|nr:alternative protein SKIV2L2 [Homo sapiens]